MPGFSGSEALVLLRSRGVDAPIIIVSSDFADADAA